MDPFSLVGPVVDTITYVLAVASAIFSLIAVFDATTRRPDAFAAADKQTKGTWSGITVACAIVAVLGVPVILGPPFGPIGLLWLASLVGHLVYLLDVRPKLREVQRGSRW